MRSCSITIGGSSGWLLAPMSTAALSGMLVNLRGCWSVGKDCRNSLRPKRVHIMKKLILATIALLSTHVLGQQYGVTSYKGNVQAVASQYYYSVLGPTTLAAGAGTFTINPVFCSGI